MSFCMRDTVSTDISTGDPMFFWHWPPSRKLSSEKPPGKVLGTAHTSRGTPWGSGAGRPPSAVWIPPLPSKSDVRATRGKSDSNSGQHPWVVDCLLLEGAPYRSVAGEPRAVFLLCIFDKVCSSRISESGISGTSLFLSCEGIVVLVVVSSSSMGVSNSTLPSSDSFTSPISCCNIFLDHGENFSSLCTPPCSAKAQSWSRAPKCSGPKEGGKAAATTPGYSLIVYSITEAPPLLHDHKA